MSSSARKEEASRPPNSLATLWIATQWTAAALDYQPQLGPPWFVVFGWPVYPPYAFFVWMFFYDAYAPRIFETGALIA
ncbi:MAG: hypothetical protein HOL43_07090, partial [Verrucomicrobiales bacterium]|nr:hypothetical protein [Verrucomicrobiales bacterium]